MNTNAEKIKNTEVKNNAIKRDGFIRITNKGAFIAKAGVAYTLNGKLVIKNTRNLPVLQGDVIIIPANATDIQFGVFIDVFFGWKNIYYTELDQVPTKCYNLYGTTFYAECVEVSCDSNDSESNLKPPIVSVPCSCCSCKSYNY